MLIHSLKYSQDYIKLGFFDIIILQKEAIFMEQTSLFDIPKFEPLASRMRPRSLTEFVGQAHLIGEGKILRRMIEADNVSSMIFWGPPGVGKTTLARIIANETKSDFITFSAVTSGIKEIKKVMEDADNNKRLGIKTIVFVDEIHRFNKAQQDAFLPFVEKGSIVLIGATTENPSFEINNALLSRCRVFVLKELSTEEILVLLKRAISDSRGFGNQSVNISEENLSIIAAFANGDARSALTSIDMIITNSSLTEDGSINVTKELIEECLSKKTLLYDKKGSEHYNIISALHKSMRNSDPDAAVYWLARMLESGENPLYIARRLIRFASEDIGLANSNALNVAINAYQASFYNGMPECNLNLAHAVIYLSMAPKSNAVLKAYEKAKYDALNTIDEPVPLHLRNAVTKLDQELGYSKDYKYAHNEKNKIAKMPCLPQNLQNQSYYEPTTNGQEKAIKDLLQSIKNFKAK